MKTGSNRASLTLRIRSLAEPRPARAVFPVNPGQGVNSR